MNVMKNTMMLISLLCAGWLMAADSWDVEKTLDIAEVPSTFPVGFCLLTRGERQYVAFYDKENRMTVAVRALGDDHWQFQVLPSKVEWDSHNYVTMAIDGSGDLHVSGNMHVVPLVYFRTEKPGDITTLRKMPMTGEQENHVTYPQFFMNHQGQLIFTYRDGGSGNGNTICNKYDLCQRAWGRLLSTPLFDGRGRSNAYPLGPIRGQDGWFHIVWVWRDAPDCATNHHLSYARSRDLIHWESILGEHIPLPLTPGESRLWVDPIPSGGGIINGCQKLFFDADGQPVITYHKSDTNGNMQIYAARPGNSKWVLHVLTEWNKPILFSGAGTMGFIGVGISGLSRAEPGVLTMTYRHRDYGSGRLILDEKTLHPMTRAIHLIPEYPEELGHIHSVFPGMGIQRVEDSGDSGSKNVRYILQWETLGSNNDAPRMPPLPHASMLRLYKLRQTR